MPSPHPLCSILYTGTMEKGQWKVTGSPFIAFSCDALAFFLCNELGDKLPVTLVTRFIAARAKVLTRVPHKAQTSCGQKNRLPQLSYRKQYPLGLHAWYWHLNWKPHKNLNDFVTKGSGWFKLDGPGWSRDKDQVKDNMHKSLFNPLNAKHPVAFGAKLSKTPPWRLFSIRSIPAFPFMSLQKDVGAWSFMLLQA